MKILYVCFVLFFSGSTLFSSTWRVSMIAEALRLCPKNVVTKSFVVTLGEITLDWCMASDESLPHLFQVVGRFQLRLNVWIEGCGGEVWCSQLIMVQSRKFPLLCIPNQPQDYLDNLFKQRHTYYIKNTINRIWLSKPLNTVKYCFCYVLYSSLIK